jgi:transcriptional regulator with XRE-family HTH domain
MGPKSPKPGIDAFTFPDRIKYFRERRGLTQASLAKLTGLTQSTIAQIEKGSRDPSISTVKKLAQALDVHVAVLFAADDVFVFDMKRLRARYDNVDKLNETLYCAWKVDSVRKRNWLYKVGVPARFIRRKEIQ